MHSCLLTAVKAEIVLLQLPWLGFVVGPGRDDLRRVRDP